MKKLSPTTQIGIWATLLIILVGGIIMYGSQYNHQEAIDERIERRIERLIQYQNVLPSMVPIMSDSTDNPCWVVYRDTLTDVKYVVHGGMRGPFTMTRYWEK